MMVRRIIGLLILAVASLGAGACSTSDADEQTAREGYCVSAKLDFTRMIRMASDAHANARDRASARSILGIFAANGDEWMRDSPRPLRSDSRAVLRASRDAAHGVHVALDDVLLVGSLLRVREYGLRCES